MSERQNGREPARSRLAVMLVKGGLAFGVVWALTLLTLIGRIVFEIL